MSLQLCKIIFVIFYGTAVALRIPPRNVEQPSSSFDVEWPMVNYAIDSTQTNSRRPCELPVAENGEIQMQLAETEKWLLPSEALSGGYKRLVTQGTAIRLVCNGDNGYLPSVRGDPISKCLSDGSWTISVGICKSLDCDTLPTIENAKIDNDEDDIDQYDVIDELSNNNSTGLKITCKEGYALVGSDKLRCENNRWLPFGYCQLIQCGTPSIENGIVAPGDISTGTQRTFTCKEGYKAIKEPAVILCRKDGQWLTESQCVENPTCGEPPNVANGQVGAGLSEVGAVRRVVCDRDYTLLGAGQVKCEADRRWNVSAYCLFEVCECFVPEIKHALIYDTTNNNKIVAPGARLPLNTTIIIKCAYDLIFSGPHSNIVCTASKGWSPAPFGYACRDKERFG